MCNNKNAKQYVNEVNGRYRFSRSLSHGEIVNLALCLQFKDLQSRSVMGSPSDVKNYFQIRLCENRREVFCVMFLSTKNHVIDCIDMFTGTIDSAAVSIREILSEVLRLNASSIIVAHNHPSGDPEPSRADIYLTKQISEALSLISVNILDHIIVGDGQTVSLAERGLIT